MRKSVFSVDVNDAGSKKKVFKAVSSFEGLQSLSIESEKKKLTVTGNIDPVAVAVKLRKVFRAKIETVGLIKDEGDEKDNRGKKQRETEQINRAHHEAYNHYYRQPCPCPHYVAVDDNPSICVIM